MDSTPRTIDVAASAFAQELHLRVAEAQASLRAAEALEDPSLDG